MIELPIEVKKRIIRGWGNAYIGYEVNELPMGVILDWDKLANAVEMTDDEKRYAIKLMDGDHYTHNGTVILGGERSE